MIDIIRYHATDAILDVDYDLEGVFYESHFPIESFKVFLAHNGFLNWHNHIFQNEEIVDERTGKMSYETFVDDYLNDEVLEKFVVSELKHSLTK